MQSNNNIIHVSSAGSGKTTYIINQALENRQDRTLITTYTNENLENIKAMIIAEAGHLPEKITIQSWFSFLLRDGVRPYQNKMGYDRRVRSIDYNLESTQFQRKENYLTRGNDIYSNKLSEFVFECNKKTGGLITARLERMYRRIFIDELQDFAGYDLEVLDILFSSDIAVEAVVDPRQATYSTNNSLKNKQYRGKAIYEWFIPREKSGRIQIKQRCDCFRCNQEICDFADSLFPNFPKTNSENHKITGHDGIYLVSENDVAAYYEKYRPVPLRYNVSARTRGCPATNIGLIKGKSYDRVLIFPTKPMLEYLRTRNLSKAGNKSRFYVAVTRARYSVAFVVSDETITGDIPVWKPGIDNDL